MQNLDEGISYFPICGQSLIMENCHNSGTSNNIDMKLGPVTKLNKRNTATHLKDDTMSANCDVIVIFTIYGLFEPILKPDSGCMVYESYIFINSNQSCKKTKNRTKNF